MVAVELGAGPALPSIVAACCGAKCVVTDQNPTLRDTCTPNCDANLLAVQATKLGGSLQAQELQWGTTAADEFSGLAPTLVLCADVIYNEEHFGVLADTVCMLLPEGTAAAQQQQQHAGGGKGGGQPSKPGGKKSKGKPGGGKKGKGKVPGLAPHALFAHRVRAKCARHGCDSDSFFDLLRTRGFTAETVELDADTAALAQRAAAVTTKSPQAIIVTKVFRAPGP